MSMSIGERYVWHNERGDAGIVVRVVADNWFTIEGAYSQGGVTCEIVEACPTVSPSLQGYRFTKNGGVFLSATDGQARLAIVDREELKTILVNLDPRFSWTRTYSISEEEACNIFGEDWVPQVRTFAQDILMDAVVYGDEYPFNGASEGRVLFERAYWLIGNKSLMYHEGLR